MISLLLFIMALGVMIMFIPPLNAFINMAQGSNFLNCNGYIDNTASAVRNLSYNSSMNTNTMACLSLKLYLPYILLVFLVGGIVKILYDKTTDFVGGQPEGGY